jgi:hypothetical protein
MSPCGRLKPILLPYPLQAAESNDDCGMPPLPCPSGALCRKDGEGRLPKNPECFTYITFPTPVEEFTTFSGIVVDPISAVQHVTVAALRAALCELAEAQPTGRLGTCMGTRLGIEARSFAESVDQHDLVAPVLAIVGHVSQQDDVSVHSIFGAAYPPGCGQDWHEHGPGGQARLVGAAGSPAGQVDITAKEHTITCGCRISTDGGGPLALRAGKGSGDGSSLALPNGAWWCFSRTGSGEYEHASLARDEPMVGRHHGVLQHAVPATTGFTIMVKLHVKSNSEQAALTIALQHIGAAVAAQHIGAPDVAFIRPPGLTIDPLPGRLNPGTKDNLQKQCELCGLELCS